MSKIPIFQSSLLIKPNNNYTHNKATTLLVPKSDILHFLGLTLLMSLCQTCTFFPVFTFCSMTFLPDMITL